MNHRTQIQRTVSVWRPADAMQAYCTCGWYAPVRNDVDSAVSDAFGHYAMPVGANGRLYQPPTYRCSGDIPAGHVDCNFTCNTIEEAMDHFEATSHNVDEACIAVDCDEPYHRATYSDLVCADCGYDISPLQDVNYDAAAGLVYHSDDAHFEMRASGILCNVDDCNKPATCYGGQILGPVDAFCGFHMEHGTN